MTVAPAMIVERTERGDEMFLTCLARYAEQVLDLDSIDCCPPPARVGPPALRPEPGDEGRHAPGPEQLWNESWYFDAISSDARLGMYARLGLYPNLGVAWVTAFVCGPDRPTARGDRLRGAAARGRGAQRRGAGAQPRAGLRVAARALRVRLRARGEEHADPASLLRGEAGEPTDVTFDLVWETLGDPYSYRVATRYEIPCRVSGTVTVGGETLALDGLGQRDHSWGTRDWWSADWMWSAGHLQDGTRVHGVEFRLPNAPALGVGYVQPPEGGVLELDSVTASEEVAGNGLIDSARIAYGELDVHVDPLAFGPLRLESPDGRVTHFPRAMCRILAADGRAGTAWVEWNRNTSAQPGAGGVEP